MALVKAQGNMYEWVDRLWNPLGGVTIRKKSNLERLIEF